MGYRSTWGRYVSVAERKQNAGRTVEKMKKKGQAANPVVINGREIARSFWGKAWCQNLEAYSDFANRLPRGRTYVRNGSVIDLQVSPGQVKALVMGSSLYTVKIEIQALATARWKTVLDHCSGQIDSLVELLQGKFSKGVMEVITSPERGLFPVPSHISMNCSCPDWATMCKHVAAVLYGVGARLDEQPELFFQLRKVDHLELLTAASAASLNVSGNQSKKIIQSGDLSGLFGIDLGDAAEGGAELGAKVKGKSETVAKTGVRGAKSRAKKAATKVATRVKKVAKSTLRVTKKKPVKRPKKG